MPYTSKFFKLWFKKNMIFQKYLLNQTQAKFRENKLMRRQTIFLHYGPSHFAIPQYLLVAAEVSHMHMYIKGHAL